MLPYFLHPDSHSVEMNCPLLPGHPEEMPQARNRELIPWCQVYRVSLLGTVPVTVTTLPENLNLVSVRVIAVDDAPYLDDNT